MVVNLLAGPLVEFGPQAFDLPGADGCLQTAVEMCVVQRVQIHLPAEDAERLQRPLAGGRLDKRLKQLAGLHRAFILRLSHPPREVRGLSVVLTLGAVSLSCVLPTVSFTLHSKFGPSTERAA